MQIGFYQAKLARNQPWSCVPWSACSPLPPICIIVKKQGWTLLQQSCCFYNLCVKCESLAGIDTVQNILNQALLVSIPNWAMQRSSAETELSLWDTCSIFQALSHMGKHQDVAVRINGFRERTVVQLFAHPLNLPLPSLFSRGWVCALLNPTRAHGDMCFAQGIRQDFKAGIFSTEILSCSRCPLQMSEMWVKLYLHLFISNMSWRTLDGLTRI